MALDATTQGQPRRVTTDNTTVEQHSLGDQIELDRYLKGKESAAVNNGLGFYATLASPPGAVNRNR